MTLISGRIVFVSPDATSIVVKADAGYVAVALHGGEDSVAVDDDIWGDWAAKGESRIKTADGQSFGATILVVAPTLAAAKARLSGA